MEAAPHPGRRRGTQLPASRTTRCHSVLSLGSEFPPAGSLAAPGSQCAPRARRASTRPPPRTRLLLGGSAVARAPPGAPGRAPALRRSLQCGARPSGLSALLRALRAAALLPSVTACSCPCLLPSVTAGSCRRFRWAAQAGLHSTFGITPGCYTGCRDPQHPPPWALHSLAPQKRLERNPVELKPLEEIFWHGIPA